MGEVRLGLERHRHRRLARQQRDQLGLGVDPEDVALELLGVVVNVGALGLREQVGELERRVHVHLAAPEDDRGPVERLGQRQGLAVGDDEPAEERVLAHHHLAIDHGPRALDRHRHADALEPVEQGLHDLALGSAASLPLLLPRRVVGRLLLEPRDLLGLGAALLGRDDLLVRPAGALGRLLPREVGIRVEQAEVHVRHRVGVAQATERLAVLHRGRQRLARVELGDHLAVVDPALLWPVVGDHHRGETIAHHDADLFVAGEQRRGPVLLGRERDLALTRLAADHLDELALVGEGEEERADLGPCADQRRAHATRRVDPHVAIGRRIAEVPPDVFRRLAREVRERPRERLGEPVALEHLGESVGPRHPPDELGVARQHLRRVVDGDDLLVADDDASSGRGGRGLRAFGLFGLAAGDREQ